MSYSSELTNAMKWLGERDNTVFLGQSVLYPGNAIFKTLCNVPDDKKIEMPVAEEMQLGMSIGMAMAGKIPITIFPRMDFLMCCMNQLVNHLDKKLYPGKVIIRTFVGSKEPLNPGVQHCGDYTEVMESLLKDVHVIKLPNSMNIMPAYIGAFSGKGSYLMIEYGDSYGME